MQIPSEFIHKISKAQGDREGMIPAQFKQKTEAILDTSDLEIKGDLLVLTSSFVFSEQRRNTEGSEKGQREGGVGAWK